jgi:acyl carrier protein
LEKSERIKKAIFAAIDEINLQLSKEKRLEKSLDTVLLGDNSGLDSVEFITFVVVTEQKIENEFGITITLTNEQAISKEKSPFKDVGNLTEYISELLER